MALLMNIKRKLQALFQEPAKTRFSAETTGTLLLVLLLLITPLSEAIKNILIIGLFVWWLTTQKLKHEIRRIPLYLVSVILLSVVPIISLATSDIVRPLYGIFDFPGSVKFALLLLPIYSLSKKYDISTGLVTICVIAGGLVACVEGFIRWQHSMDPYPLLKALAGVNDSALYMCIVLICAISLSWSRKPADSVLGYIGIMVSCWSSVVLDAITASVVMVCILFFAMFLSLFTHERKKFIVIIASLGILSGVVSAVFDANVYWSGFTAEFNRNMFGKEKGSKRFEIINTVIEVYDRNPWFGVGYRRFGEATSVERVSAELEAEGRSYHEEQNNFHHNKRGHNVWAQILIERGLIGIALLLLFFVSSAFCICKGLLEMYSRKEYDLHSIQLIFIAGAIWMTLFVGGIGITAFHFEHGMMALVLLVWSLSRFHNRHSPPLNKTS